MAVIDKTTTTISDSAPYSGGGPVSYVKLTVDCSADPAASGDDYKFGAFPTSAQILCGWVKVTTVEGAADTADIGVAQNGTSLVSSLDLNTLGVTDISPAAPVPISSGYIWVNADAALTVAVFEIHLIVAYPDADL
jgi:hypothetical protein